METNLLRRVYLNGDPERLPIDSGIYSAHDKEWGEHTTGKYSFDKSYDTEKYWMNHIDYYLIPVPLEEIIQSVRDALYDYDVNCDRTKIDEFADLIAKELGG